MGGGVKRCQWSKFKGRCPKSISFSGQRIYIFKDDKGYEFIKNNFFPWLLFNKRRNLKKFYDKEVGFQVIGMKSYSIFYHFT